MLSSALLKLLQKKSSRASQSQESVVKTPKNERPYRQKADHIAYDYDYSQKEVLRFKPAPKIVVKKKPNDFVNMSEFRVYLKLYLSKNPHFVFQKIHQSSLSDSVKQILFYDEKKKVIIAMTFRDFVAKVKVYGTVNLGLKSFDEKSESLDN